MVVMLDAPGRVIDSTCLLLLRVGDYKDQILYWWNWKKPQDKKEEAQGSLQTSHFEIHSSQTSWLCNRVGWDTEYNNWSKGDQSERIYVAIYIRQGPKGMNINRDDGKELYPFGSGSSPTLRRTMPSKLHQATTLSQMGRLLPRQ